MSGIMRIIKLSSYFRNQHLTLILLPLIKPYKYKWLRSPAGVLIYPCHFMNHRIDNVGKITDTPPIRPDRSFREAVAAIMDRDRKRTTSLEIPLPFRLQYLVVKNKMIT
jgi:hypothetical protein